MGLLRSRVFILVLCEIVWTIKPINCFTIQPDHSSTTTVPARAPVDDTVPSASYVSDPALLNHEVMQRTRQSDDCIVLNITESLLGLQRIKEFRDKSLTFFIRPKTSFRKLVFRIKLKNVLDVTEAFFSEKAIDLHSSDLLHSEAQPWTRVHVDYFLKPSRGPNYHALRVTVDNSSLQLVTKYRWVFHRYEGFAIYAEGGAQIAFNCPGEVLQEIPIEASSSSGVWLMVGLLTTASILLLGLLLVWLATTWRRKNQSAPTPSLSPVYEEFDDEVLEKIRQKVETLRSGKSLGDLKNAVSFEPDRENSYVTLVKGRDSRREENEESPSQEKHLYVNVYFERPTPAARLTKETPSSDEAQISSLMPGDNLPCDVVGGVVANQTVVGSTLEKSPGEGNMYQNLSTVLSSQEQIVKTDS